MVLPVSKIYGGGPLLYFIPQQYLVSVLIDELILALYVTDKETDESWDIVII